MDEWKLVKPERELYILINRLRITANAINTFILTGEKDLFIGDTEQDDWFLALKDFYEGNKQFVGAEEPAEVTYGKAHNVKSLDDAKKYWTLQVAALFCEEKYWIRKISEHKSSFSTFPKWLQNRCRFVVEEFDKYFCYFISKDEDCGYLTQMLFMPALAKIPTRLRITTRNFWRVVNHKEWFAECFAEAMDSQEPREMAKTLLELLDSAI